VQLIPKDYLPHQVEKDYQEKWAIQVHLKKRPLNGGDGGRGLGLKHDKISQINSGIFLQKY